MNPGSRVFGACCSSLAVCVLGLVGLQGGASGAPVSSSWSRQDVKKSAPGYTATYFDSSRTMSKATVISVSGNAPLAYKDAGLSVNFRDGKGVAGARSVTDMAAGGGVLSFTTQKSTTLYWGNHFGGNSVSPLSIGARLSDRWYPMVLVARIKQSLPISKWKADYRWMWNTQSSPEVTLSGTEWQELRIPLGDTRGPISTLALVSQDAGNNVQIESVRVCTPSARQCFRSTIDLKGVPADAGMDIVKGPWQKLYINGRLVGSAVYPGSGNSGMSGTTYKNLAKYFKKGKNTIAVESEYYTWMSPSTDLAVDGLVRMKDGRVQRILSDAAWKAAFDAPEGWVQPAFDDSKWASAKPVKPFFKIMGANYSPISMKSPGKYFIFDSKEPVNIPVSVPPYTVTTAYNVNWRVVEAKTQKEVRSGVLAKGLPAAKGFGGNVKTPLLPGAYELTVDVTSAGKVVETNVQEFAVTGKIAQREVKGTSYADGLDLELTDDIDLTDPNSQYKIFSQSAGGKDIPSPVVEGKAGKYRESGTNTYDWFGFAVKLDKIYQPYVVEVDYPDDAKRVMSVRTMEMTAEPGGVINDGFGTRGWGLVAPGMHTGIEKRLSNKTKTLRYIIFPKVPVTGFSIMTQQQGLSAAASRVRIYRIKNDLPALKIGSPDSRVTGQHLERLNVMPVTFGTTPDEFKFSMTYWSSMHRGFYKNWYDSVENLIKYMRFSGENMLIAGLYMYYPENDFTWTTKESANAAELLGRMCAANGIKIYLGVEYSRPGNAKMVNVTDDQVAAGAETMFTVSKEGKQAKNWCYTTNMFAPTVRRDLKDVMQQLADLYKNTPGIAGIAYQEGSGAWLPGISYTVTGTQDPLDWGYDDITVGLFAKETGLKIPGDAKDPKRFMVRYDWIMKNARDRWIDWRNKKVYQLNRELAAISEAANPNWKMYVFTGIFNDPKLGTPLELMRRSGFDPALYANDKTIVIGNSYGNSIRELGKGEAALLKAREWSENLETIKAVDGKASFVGTGFFEMSQTSDTWYYSLSLCCDYVFQSGRDFLYPYTRVLSYATPQCMAQTWLDVDMMSGYEEERREFNRAFRVLPKGDYKNLAGNGLDANIAVRASINPGKTSFYVVNRAGWPVETTLNVKLSPGAKVKDLALGELVQVTNGKITFAMKAYEMQSLQIVGNGQIVGAETRVSPEAAEELSRYANEKTELYRVVEKIDKSRLDAGLKSMNLDLTAEKLIDRSRKIVSAADSGDYLTVAVMTDSYRAVQLEKFLATMKEYLAANAGYRDGYRIDCGSEKSYTDANGNTWLADDSWMGGAKDWGFDGGSTAGRGQITVENTVDSTVYRTEHYGMTAYNFHLKPGDYLVRLHFAETFDYTNGGDRVFDVSIQGKKVLSDFEIFREAGGRKKAVVKEFTVPGVTDVLSIEFGRIKASPKVDAIEVIRIAG